MSPTSYLIARGRGAPLVALPIPLYRQFPHGLLLKPKASPLSGPAALAGQAIAARTWAQPTAVWLRGILHTAYGVDLDSLTWLLIAEDPVPDLPLPSNVRRVAGDTLEDLLRTGQAQAAIGPRTDDPDLARVLPKAVERAREWYRQTGVIPINHLLVVREAVLDAHPWVAAALLAAFQQAKDAYLRDRRGARGTAATDQHLADLAAVVGEDGDLLPYGTAANWPALALLMEFMVVQGLLPRPLDRRRVLAPTEG
jgi:4,5-dihydroxyphthalate decarboxylase